MTWMTFVKQPFKCQRISSSANECDVFVFNQPVSESKILSAKVEELDW